MDLKAESACPGGVSCMAALPKRVSNEEGTEKIPLFFRRKI
jgi:hypothetical protein